MENILENPLATRLLAWTILGTLLVGLACSGPAELEQITVFTPAGLTPVASVVASPSAVTMLQGSQQQLTATAKDKAGNELPDSTITWKSDNETVATVGPLSGLLTGLGRGTAIVTATSQGSAGVVAVTVQLPPVASAEILPAAVTIEVGAQRQLTPALKDEAGNQLIDRETSWESGNPAAASVSESGLVQGLAPGTSTVSLFSEGKRASVVITVVPAAPLGSSPESIPKPPPVAQPRFNLQVQVSPSDAKAAGASATGSGDYLPGSAPVVNATIQTECSDGSNFVFHNWGGVDPELELKNSSKVTMDSNRIAVAFYQKRECGLALPVEPVSNECFFTLEQGQSEPCNLEVTGPGELVVQAKIGGKVSWGIFAQGCQPDVGGQVRFGSQQVKCFVPSGITIPVRATFTGLVDKAEASVLIMLDASVTS